MSPRARRRQRPGPPRALCLTLLFLVLGGLFAMHGLAGHGAGSAHASEPAVVGAGHAAAAHHAGPAMAGMTVMTAEPVAAGLVAFEQAAGDDGTAMAGMCVAVLAGFALGLLAPRRTSAVVPVPTLLASPHPVRVGRDRAPPSLHALSVHRC